MKQVIITVNDDFDATSQEIFDMFDRHLNGDVLKVDIAPVVKDKTLLQLCEAIEAGYADEKSGMDDDMIPLLQELADRTEEIKALIDRVHRQAS